MAGYATLAVLMGMPNEAIGDLTKELAAHPDSVQAYPMMVGLLFRSPNRHAETVSVLRRWVAADSTNPQPAMALMEMLNTDHNMQRRSM